MNLSKFAPAVRVGALFAGALWIGACNSKPAGSPEEESLRRGRSLYTLNCTACHHVSDPAKDGSLGPAIQGSSLELLQARVVRGEYPPGYAPKRPTRVMQKLPLTETDLRDLHAFLNAAR